MKKTRRILAMFLVAVFLILGSSECFAATKGVMVAGIKGDTLRYYKAVSGGQYFNQEAWENAIGIGKVKTAKLTKETKYYLRDWQNISRTYKVTKAAFKKNLHESKAYTFKGKKYYSGTACEVTIKNGMVTKITESYQS